MPLLPIKKLQHAWERMRPLPSPAYLPRTPAVGEVAPPGVFQIPNVPTLAAAATSREAIEFLVDLISKLTSSKEFEGQQAYYQLAQAQFGRYMRFADLTTAL